eukprot:scaffold13064_cov85-Skeletonema_marinoi.AAC.1
MAEPKPKQTRITLLKKQYSRNVLIMSRIGNHISIIDSRTPKYTAWYNAVEKEPWTLEPPLCFGLLAVAVAVLLVAVALLCEFVVLSMPNILQGCSSLSDEMSLSDEDSVLPM